MAQSPSNTVDFRYLEDFVAGDKTVMAEVLGLFLQQAELWRPRLAGDTAGWADLAHNIKGAARGIGATRLGDAAARAEAGGVGELPAVTAELDAATADIAAYLKAAG